eukprot:CAMPEP_0184489356 /NCGR_PEP_ID=MMETSP0113_2-20130426/15152_1 /TAXON_ID=91329 /ORGANISM="Norrisiella sphaerica, Strain BC52" /LENGTH=317 /DNA_ID=CAMNT_0026872717 /DNA_START=403 /DNA_END=1356 /DNA_ORIENTATION=-
MEHKFELLAKMPTEATYKPIDAGGLGATNKQISARTRKEFYEVSKEITYISSGTRPSSPKQSSMIDLHRTTSSPLPKPKKKLPTFDPKLIGKSKAQKLMMKQLEEYRSSEQARKELKTRAFAHLKSKNVGKQIVDRNKLTAGNRQSRLEEVAKTHQREKERRALAAAKKEAIERKKAANLEKAKALVNQKLDPLYVAKRKEKRMQQTWLTLLALTSRALCCMDTITAQQSPLDYKKLMTQAEKEHKSQPWLVRRRVMRTRDALGSLWRCLVVQQVFDKLRHQIMEKSRQAGEGENAGKLEYEYSESEDEEGSDVDYD